ncbi:hypothetical protein OA40_02885 [Morganella morganii]|uniref:hypothetical protein n=1 Tax=Morganella morganii TaxID=582 RepID=UPI00062C98CC|nr:hypothetical protein [Morganella morganii]KKY70353.1 hypothetical protein OA40_02885 [Morganella morganii]
MYNVNLFYKKSNHINQYIYGFLLLQKQKIIKINLINNSCPDITTQHILRAEVNGKKFIYDANDGDHIDRGFFSLPDYNWCDVYYKRSFSPQLSEKFPKCQPLGFNYDIKPVFSRWEEISVKCRRALGKDIIKHTDLEADPIVTDNPKLLFLTRLWDPDTVRKNHNGDAGITDEYHKLNDFRLMVLDTIKEKFSSSAMFGLSDNEYTRKVAPDYILPPELTSRRKFIQSLKGYEICIATTGLHDSTGWRFGEYIASSRAIISDPLRYIPTGNYYHYLPFENKKELIFSIEKLMNNRSLRLDLMLKNKKYYSEFLSPDKLILNTILNVNH